MRQVVRIRTMFLLLLAGLLSFSQAFANFHACEMACCKIPVVSADESNAVKPSKKDDCCHHESAKPSISAQIKCCCDEAQVNYGPEKESFFQLRILESTSADFVEPAALPVLELIESESIRTPSIDLQSHLSQIFLESRRPRGPPSV